MIDILANVGKKFKLRKSIPGVYNHLKFPEGTLLELKEIELGSSSATIVFKLSKSNDLTKIEKELLDKFIAQKQRDLTKRKTLYAKIVKIWEETPEIFKPQERWWKDDKVYDCTVPELMGKDYMNGFVTGCGSNTYYSKEWFQNHLDNWDKLVDEELKDTKRMCKSIMRDTLKEDIDIKYSDINEIIELDEKAKVTRRPNIDFSIDADELIRIFDEFDNDFDIDKEFIDRLVELEFEDKLIDKFKKFIGSSISVSSEGEMYNDGQILEYTITLSTKEGHEYYIHDSHCAITGWRLSGEVEFK
jgi:hypothetical protein